MAANQNLAQAMTRYSPQVQQQARRSQYLTDALAAMQSSGENIRSPWELAAKLAGVALLNRGANKAQRGLADIVKAEKDARLAKMLAGIPEVPPPAAAMPAPQAPALPPPEPPPAPMPMAQGPQSAAQAPPAPAAFQASPEDRDALVRMLATEAIGEGPDGMAAAGHVALNRARVGHGGANSLRDVVYAPHQFEGMSRAGQVSPDAYQKAAQVADAILSGQMPDPTGGAVNFINPELQAQMGRPIPAWAQGQGQRIGRHVFFGGQPDAQASAQAEQPIEGNDFTAQLMAAGAGADPLAPSDPGRSPPDAGAAVAGSPQAPATANPTTYQPTAQEVLLVRRLLSSGDPEEQARGEGLYWKLMERMTQAVEWETTTVNGVPAQVNKTTGELRLLQMPEGAKTQTVAPPPGVTPGTVMQQKPTGEMSVLQAPPSGFQGAPQQQSFIRGGPNDPAAGANLVANEGKLRDDYAKEIQPYVIAREGLNKVIEAAKTGNPAGDIALVFGYMKTLDPGSTVREGEQAQVANSGTIPQTVTNIYNKLLTGAGSLSPAQRAQFADSAYRQFQVYEKTFQAANDRYSGLAQGYNFDPNRIVRQFDPIEPYKAPTPAAGAVQYPAAVTQAHQNMRARGLYDPKAPLGSERRPLLAADDASLRAVDTPQNKGKWVIGPDGRKGQIQ